MLEDVDYDDDSSTEESYDGDSLPDTLAAIVNATASIADNLTPRADIAAELTRNMFTMRSSFRTPAPRPNTPLGTGPGFFGS